jgi:hypothetical protein
MSVDDPREAAKEVLASEERPQSAVRFYAAKLIGFLPSAVAEAMSKILATDSTE